MLQEKHILVKMTKIKKIQYQVLVRIWSNRNLYTLLGEMQNGLNTLENNCKYGKQVNFCLISVVGHKCLLYLGISLFYVL